jgi:hypothetical protein
LVPEIFEYFVDTGTASNVTENHPLPHLLLLRVNNTLAIGKEEHESHNLTHYSTSDGF